MDVVESALGHPGPHMGQAQAGAEDRVVRVAERGQPRQAFGGRLTGRRQELEQDPFDGDLVGPLEVERTDLAQHRDRGVEVAEVERGLGRVGGAYGCGVALSQAPGHPNASAPISYAARGS